MIVKLCIIVINDNVIYCLNLKIKSILSKLHSLCIKRSMHWLIGPKIQYNFLWLLYQNKLTSSVQTWIKNNSLKWLNPDFLSWSFTRTINRVGNIYPSRVPEITFSISWGSSFIIKPNSVRIRSFSCQFVFLLSTGFELTPLIHCSTICLGLRPAP
jgi:hypothetical protein